jgi:hypothetical protein
MDQSAFVMDSIAGCMFLILGVHIYRLSRRSIQLSESFLALTLLTWALGYALYDVPYAFVASGEQVPPIFSYTSLLTVSLGNIFLAMFTQEVFHKRDNWAGWFVVAIAVCLLLGSAGAVWVGDWEQINPLENPGYWPQILVGLVPACWLGYEGLSHTFSARKRLALGLLDPFACHRILLLGLAGALWAVLEIVIVIQDFIYINAGDWSAVLGVANGVLEIVPSIFLWLAFWPPAPYRRWIEATAPA